MSNPAPPLIESHHPMTFRSRGAAVLFTTPLLAGARVREAKPAGIELVVPNPSGSRGVYVLNWSGVRGLCNPTVHDTLLFRQCSRLRSIEPASVRDAALEVARDGHAGREASAAAETAIANDRSEDLLAHFTLMTGLVAQLDPGDGAALPTAERVMDLDRRASAVLHRIAPSLRRPAADLANGLIAIGDLFAAVGVASTDRHARIPRLLIRLADTHADLSGWLDAGPDNDIGGLGKAITAAMRGACENGTALLEQTRSPLKDPAALLRRWITDPSGILAHATRCDWLLDGWERVSLLWCSASTEASRRAALLEMAPLVPMLPREALEWTGTPVSVEATKEPCRVTSHQDAWRIGGSAIALIERNEKLLAMTT